MVRFLGAPRRKRFDGGRSIRNCIVSGVHCHDMLGQNVEQSDVRSLAIAKRGDSLGYHGFQVREVFL
jgi:hypothetical protein